MRDNLRLILLSNEILIFNAGRKQLNISKKQKNYKVQVWYLLLCDIWSKRYLVKVLFSQSTI
jgi:hypothetical protein